MTVSVVDAATGIPVENAMVGLARSDVAALSRTNATGVAAFAVNAICRRDRRDGRPQRGDSIDGIELTRSDVLDLVGYYSRQ